MRLAPTVMLVLGCAARGAPEAPSSTVAPPSAPSAPSVAERVELAAQSAPGVSVAVRFVRSVDLRDGVGRPVLLVHGAGGGGVASFDLPVPGYSLAEDLARAGHPVYVMDVRGWGRSTRPPALAAPPEAHPPAVTSDEAVEDIAAAVAAIRARHGGAPVALVGWATGGHWAGMYAARHPDAVTHLAMLNALYGAPGPWSLRAALEDPARPGEPALQGAYARRDGRSLVARWEATIPLEDKDAWRDPQVSAAYIAATLAADPEAARTDPPKVRVPTGPLRDSFLVAGGASFWRAGDLRARVLALRGELDFWSRPEDLAALARDLPSATCITLPGATHFVHLDRPERGRRALLSHLLAFLASSERGPR